MRLRPVVESDHDYLYRLAMQPEVGFRWRTQGSSPNPVSFVETLWRDVLVQFISESVATGEPVGLVTCFAANMREGWAHVALVADPRWAHTGVVMSPMTLLLNYVFTLWNFRKLYMESAHYNYMNISSGEGRLFHEEGKLKDHMFHNGRYWDLHVLAIYRKDWDKNKDRALGLALPRRAAAR
ncbi:MAG: hypothetical protein QOE92_1764 [Chloroflexota bacterium]|nr:hypothetical protein [Chloroflexota bacterium]